MLVALDPRFNKNFRDICLFYVVTVIVFTVCINGLTIKFLMQKTGFLEEDLIKKKIKKSLENILFKDTERRMKQLSEMQEFGGAQWDNVEKLTKLKKFNDRKKKEEEKIEKLLKENEENIESSTSKFKNTKALDSQTPRNDINNPDGSPKENNLGVGEETEPTEEVLSELRFRVYRLIKHQIHEKRDANECTFEVVRALKNVCDICTEHIDKEICVNEYSKIYIGNNRFLEITFKLTKIPIIGYFFTNSFASQIFFKYQFLETLNSCLKFVENELKETKMNLFCNKTLRKVREEIKLNILKLEKLANTITLYFDEYVGFIKTKTAAYTLIQFQKQQIEEFEHFGMIDDKEKNNWTKLLDRKVVQVNRFKPNLEAKLKQNFSTFVLDYPIFSGLTDDQI